MLDEVSGDAYEAVRPLFAGLERHLIVDAVLEGLSPGRVYVDDPARPRAAFLSSPEGHFLGGDPGDGAFARELHRLIFDTLFDGDAGSAAGDRLDSLYVVCSSESWVPHLTTIMAGRTPLAEERLYYEFVRPRIDWRAALPDDIALRQVDAALLARTDLQNHAAVAGWVEGNWGTVDAFLARGVGCCLVHGDAIASWSLADCAVGARCEIGIETNPAYRRRGLATLVTAATVETCLARGLSRIGWHCWERNLGSRGVAERVGFARSAAYTMYWCLADEARHQAEGALLAARRGDRGAVTAWYERACGAADAPGWVYFYAAACLATLGEHAAALERLHEAIDRGVDPAWLGAAEVFAPLRPTAEWAALMARARAAGEPGI